MKNIEIENNYTYHTPKEGQLPGQPGEVPCVHQIGRGRDVGKRFDSEERVMGIYLPNMEMPESCYNCDLTNDGFYLCKAAHPYKPLENDCEERRPPWCPLAEIQTPHGRLIDADALIEDLERQCKEVFRIDAVSPDDYWITRNETYNEALWKSWVESFGEYLKTRPTIIEAEAKENAN